MNADGCLPSEVSDRFEPDPDIQLKLSFITRTVNLREQIREEISSPNPCPISTRYYAVELFNSCKELLSSVSDELLHHDSQCLCLKYISLYMP